MFGYAQLLLPDSVAAAEVVDAVLDAAAERAGGDDLRALMYAAVRRECRTRRLASGWASYASEPGVLPAKLSVGGLGMENIGSAGVGAAERYLQAAAMTQVLAGLPERQRELLSLAFWHGLSPAELGTIFAIPAQLAQEELASASARFASLVAVVVLLQSGRSDCADLDRIIVGSFAATPGYELCREVASHGMSCDACSDTVASRGLGPLRVEDLPAVELSPSLDRQLASFAQSLDTTPRVRVPLWGSTRSGAARLGLGLLRRIEESSASADTRLPEPRPPQTRTRLLGAAASALAVVGIVAGVMVLGKFTITPATEANGSSSVQVSGAPSQPGGGFSQPGQAGQFQAQRPGGTNSTLPIFTSPGPPFSASSAPIPLPSSGQPSPPPSSSPTKPTKSPRPSRSPSTPPPPPTTSPPPWSPSPSPTSASPSPTQSQSATSASAGTSPGTSTTSPGTSPVG